MRFDWKEYTLDDVCERIFSGGTPSTMHSEYWNGTLKWLSSGETSQRFIYDTERKITELGVKNSSTKLATRGCTVIATAGQGFTRGQASFLMTDTFLNQSVIACKPNEKYVLPLFLYYNLDNRYDEFRLLSDGTSTRGGLSGWILKRMTIMLPPLSEQKKIAAILSALDEKIAINRAINDNLQQQLRSIFKAELTDNPDLESMTQIPLSDLCLVVTKGTTPTTLGKPFVESGINFIKAESILADHSIDKSKFAFIDEETNALLKRSIIHAGDVVFTIAGTLGRFALIDENVLPANTNQAVAIIRADVEKVLPEYIYSCFIGEWHTDYYAKRVQQAVQANLSLTTIKSLPIPLLDDVKMGEYLKLILPIIKSIKVNEAQNKKLAALRDNLLPKLMSGAIDVSDIQF